MIPAGAEQQTGEICAQGNVGAHRRHRPTSALLGELLKDQDLCTHENSVSCLVDVLTMAKYARTPHVGFQNLTCGIAGACRGEVLLSFARRRGAWEGSRALLARHPGSPAGSSDG